MKRDVMQAAGLEIFAEVAIIIFFITFAILALKTLLGSKSKYEEIQKLPLDDGVEVNS